MSGTGHASVRMTTRGARVLLIGSETRRTNERAVELAELGYEVRSAPPDAAALDIVEQFEPQVTIVDLSAEDAAATFLETCRERFSTFAFVGLTESTEPDEVADAVTTGADLTSTHTASAPQLVPLIERALERAKIATDAQAFRRRTENLLSQANFEGIIGSHPAMQGLLKKVAQVAQTRATVLITGESGTGKELIASALHHNSKRRHGPFVRLNCAALSETVLESELFGHERGAFTGAVARRDGRFQQADGGTLFLDEISEIAVPMQVKLLRFLQEREFERVGGNETMKVDVRVIAATNRDLSALVQDGKFREDLYYRLKVVCLDVPPLRARPSDIYALADHFLRRAARENEVEMAGFTPAARNALIDYPWPGNVRELENTIEQAVVLSETGRIDSRDLPIAPPTGEPAASLKIMIPGTTMAELERYAITETLKAVGGSPSRAASILGISTRTVQYRLREWSQSTPPDAPLDMSMIPTSADED